MMKADSNSTPTRMRAFFGMILLLFLSSALTLLISRKKMTPMAYPVPVLGIEIREETDDRIGKEDAAGLFGKVKKGTNYVVVYNNVPKCGSRSLIFAIRDAMSKRKHFTMKRIEKENRHRYVKLTRELDRLASPALACGHMPHIKLNRSDVIYINMVRDPVQRFISAFYFKRNGDSGGVIPQGGGRENMTLEEYVHTEKFNESEFYMKQFFLSERDYCANEEDNLAKAKRMIEEHYTFVGLTEQMETTMSVLEKILPDLFKGLKREYTKRSKASKIRFATKGKELPSEATIAILKEYLKYDYQLYEYIKKRFQETQGQLRTTRQKT